MNPEALAIFNNLSDKITSPHIKRSFQTLLHQFLQANGNPRPEHAKAKSSSAISRMLNQYNFPTLKLLRASREQIEKVIWQHYGTRGTRRPKLELIIDMTTLEKTGIFKELPISYFNEKNGLHLVVLYVVIGNQRFVWAVRVWKAKATRTWVGHALSMLRLIPAWFKLRFNCRVLADTGFGTTEFLEGCEALELAVVVGMRHDRKTTDTQRINALPQGSSVILNDCSVGVWFARYKLWHKDGSYEWRYVVSSRPAVARTIIAWGKRRWRIEAFFRVMKSRFGLDQFGQRTKRGVLRFLLIAFIAYLLVLWTGFPFTDEENPDWIALAGLAQLWLLTWVVQFELKCRQEQVNEVLKFKVSVVV